MPGLGRFSYRQEECSSSARTAHRGWYAVAAPFVTWGVGPIWGCRVEMWRGGFRLGLSVSGPFGCRCLTSLAMAPFPHPAHQTGRAVFPHPAFGQGCTSYAASHVRPRTIAAMFVEAGVSPASGADVGHGTVSFHHPSP